MDTVGAIIVVGSIFWLIFGLIYPIKAAPFLKQPNRLKVFGVYLLINFVIGSLLGSSDAYQAIKSIVTILIFTTLLYLTYSFIAKSLKNKRKKKEYINKYKERLIEVFTSSKYNDIDKAALDGLCKEILLDNKDRTDIEQEAFKEYLDDLINPDDYPMSYENTIKMNAAANFLNLSPSSIVDAKILQAITTLGIINEKSALQEFCNCDVNVQLKKDENILWVIEAYLNKYKTKTERVNYGGPVVSIPIIKGVRYRVGSIKVEPVKREYLETVDIGEAIFTTKRLIFIGNKNTISIDYKKILSIEECEAGLAIKRENTVNPVYMQLPNYLFPLKLLSFINQNEDYELVQPAWN